ncbi:DUF3987 domain-containing protein [uncultured Endozoicomonas sp.]|uniref:DUF3987 domain-containing protein n=1 Tax=uncultured Endozoicomonas sp. TaxID=432652 RepID=UPI002630823F|nr:DUF3987 domain-containing protein [uncultured Endozoicomonas sp.]
MKKVKTTTYTPPVDETLSQKPRPVYMDGAIYKEHFNANGTERNKQANKQAMSQRNELNKAAPAKTNNHPDNAPDIKPAAYTQPHDADNEDHFNTPPTVPDNAFPPCLQSAVGIACHGTEAHPMAVALHYVVYFAANIGQQRYIRIGNEKHNLNFYGLLVGKTGKVKGTAESQARFIEQLATADLVTRYSYKPPRKLSGLSSGEGLIEAIKDPGDEEDDKAWVDKRLLITESEYANVLTQDQRGGNTLSVILRDAYDGKTLSNLTVTSRVATSPHISIIGHITPGELLGHKSFLSQSVNGALNRNLIFFARREQTTPTPRQYTPEEAESLSQWFAESIYRARDQSNSDNYQVKLKNREMVMSDPAKDVITKEYHRREAEQDAMPELLANLVSRHRVFVWRLSAILALMDGTDTVAAEHVQQAYRWLDYSLDSIRYLLGTARQEAEQEEVMSLADTIYDFLLSYNNGEGASSTDISRILFSGNKKAKDIAPALKALIDSTPPRVEQFQPEKKGRGKKKTIFKPITTK